MNLLILFPQNVVIFCLQLLLVLFFGFFALLLELEVLDFELIVLFILFLEFVLGDCVVELCLLELLLHGVLVVVLFDDELFQEGYLFGPITQALLRHLELSLHLLVLAYDGQLLVLELREDVL